MSVTNQIPTSTSAPMVSGSASFGSSIGIDRGSWEGFPEPEFSYQWYACNEQVNQASDELPAGCVETGISLGDMISVDTGSEFSCAVISNGTVQCWGSGFYGQLGNGGTSSSSTPQNVSGISNAVSVSAGYRHACATLSSGEIKCWGQGTLGQLGNGGISSSLVPVTVSNISSAVSVSAGNVHTCALLEGGLVQCWGAGSYLGNGQSTRSTIPVSAQSNAISVSAGESHTCALLSNSQISCWGEGTAGQLGNGASSSALSPVTVSNISTATSVDAGSNATCATLASGSVRCWGFVGWSGGGTQGLYAYRSTPGTVSGVSSAIAVSSGPFTTRCALLVDGTVVCWRGGGSNLLPHGVSITQSTPFPTAEIESATSISSRGGFSTSGHYCATISNDTVRCWGAGSLGELGNGGTSSSSIGLEVLSPRAIRPTAPALAGKHLLAKVIGSNEIGTTAYFTASTGPIQ
jgi:alpha-tubulin suppressor-like RCC1 family protein